MNPSHTDHPASHAQGQLAVEAPGGSRPLPFEPGAGAGAATPVLTQLLAKAELPLNTRCGQRGQCEGCLVELVRGRLRDVHGRTIDAANDDAPVAVRACQHEPCADTSTVIRVPARSLLATQPQVLSTFKINVPRTHDPLWQRVAWSAAAGHGGQWPVRLPGAEPIGNGKAPASEVILSFAGDHWQARPATAADPQRPLGAAIDIGTTTVVVMIVELDRGRIVGRASDTNVQVRFGDNVLTRIEHCARGPEAVTELQRAVVEHTLRPLLKQALAKAEASTQDLVCLTVAGNTTMLHLLAGTDPSPMGTVPFAPAFLDHRIVDVSEVGLLPQVSSAGAGRVPVHLLPGAAAYLGADVMAGALSSGLAYDEQPSLLVDVGTNGEIIARLDEKLVGCATAAGPTFEGAGLAWGMRAGDGAISHVRFDGDPLTPRIECIGAGPPIGICGSAYIDLLAEGRRTHLIDPRGRIDTALARAADLYADAGCHGAALRIARAADSPDILVTESDIATLLQAKAAIAAGITTLLHRLEMRPADVHRLYLAGGFGMHVVTDHALRCGLLPGFRRQQVQLVGNTALAGAYLALLDAGALTELTRLRQRIEIVELNLDPAFESAFIDHLALP